MEHNIKVYLEAITNQLNIYLAKEQDDYDSKLASKELETIIANNPQNILQSLKSGKSWLVSKKIYSEVNRMFFETGIFLPND